MLQLPNVKFISMLQSNTSRLESHFAFVRGRGLDSTLKYSKSNVVLTLKNARKNIQTSSNFNCGNEAGNNEGSYDLSAILKNDFSTFDFERWMKECLEKVFFNTSNTLQLCSFSNITEFEKKIRLDITDGSFYMKLLAYDLMREWTILSILSKDVKSIFLQMNKFTEDESRNIQNLIISFTYQILKTMDAAICVSSDTPYEFGLFKITVGLNHDIKHFFSNISGHEKELPWAEINAIAQTISMYMQKEYIKFKYYDKKSENQFEFNYANDEIVRFLGFALFKTRRKWRRKIETDHDDITYDDGFRLLDSLRFFHNDAIVDDAYCKEVYNENSALRLSNHLYLTLPRMELMEFGKRLLSLLNNLVSENEMVQKGNKTYEHAKELIFGDKILIQLFTEAINQITNRKPQKLTKIELLILKQLIVKSLNSRINATIQKFNDTKNESKNVKTRSWVKSKVKNQAAESKQRKLQFSNIRDDSNLDNEEV